MLDPVQFAAELATLKQRPHYDGHALLCELPDRVARLFESKLVPTGQSLAISGSEDGLLCAVVTLQAASTQVVCIVPMLGPLAKNWLFEAVESLHRMNIVVSIADKEQVIVVTSGPPVLHPDGQEWQTIRRRLDAVAFDGDRDKFVTQLLDLLRRLDADVQSAIPGFAVDERWVFAITPPAAPVGGDVDVRSGTGMPMPAGAALH
ncbi:urocanate hydratase [Thiomonas sp. X19]|uniref:urocanate hydratase n=1 Tax=Thiomonas sp. X19 TaxID=1050370 RepID=UPI001E588A3A|nr:urocanate hydratase [Thiomonas sp. X19]